MTKRENILANIKTTLEAVSGVKHVSVDKSVPADIPRVPMPACFVYSEPEGKSPAPIGQEAWTWTVVIEVWTRGSAEELLGKIHTEMHADYKRGGFAKSSYRTSADFWVIDSEKDVRVMMIKYAVEYSHAQGAM